MKTEISKVNSGLGIMIGQTNITDKIDQIDKVDTDTQTYTISDYIHSVTTPKPFIKEIVLIALAYWFYTTSSSSSMISFVKYTVIVMLIRYILSEMTQIVSVNDKKKQFQLNAHVMIFMIIVLIMNRNGVLSNQTLVTSILVIAYSLLVVTTRDTYTSDVVMTVLFVYSFFNNPFIMRYLEEISAPSVQNSNYNVYRTNTDSL